MPNCGTNNAGLGLEPGNACSAAMCLNTDIGSDGESDMVALGALQPIMATFDAGELLQAAVVDLDLPSIKRMESNLFQGHVQVAGGPVFIVAICADRLEDLDPTIPFEVDNLSLPRNEDITHVAIARAINAHQSVCLLYTSPSPRDRS